MLKYLILLLDDTATSYCHYSNHKTEKRLISLEDLKTGILFAMKQNLMIQFVYPSYELPAEYKDAIETIDHVKIMPAESKDAASADVLVFNSCEDFSEETIETHKEKIFVLRMQGRGCIKSSKMLNRKGRKDFSQSEYNRLNIILTDIETFTESDFDTYKAWLSELGLQVANVYRSGKVPQINILTDRILLKNMNNCNAGVENITLAPNGKFYVCPAFYLENEEDSVGDLKNGVDIKNQQLYKLEYAPLCRICDAYQCKRCVWLNRKTTLEVNTPSHEQCVVAHLERNASENLLKELKPAGYFHETEIPTIDYLDPFDIKEQF